MSCEIGQRTDEGGMTDEQLRELAMGNGGATYFESRLITLLGLMDNPKYKDLIREKGQLIKDMLRGYKLVK